MSLKAVIFDFGGVLARTRSQHLRAAWEQRLSLRPGEASELVFGGESGRAAQHGWVSDAEHWAFIQRRLGLDDATLAQFRRDFFAEDGIDTDLLAYIDRVRTGYQVGLLSNATSTARRFFKESGIAGHFDAITISGEEGVMKPDERIYRIALARLGVQPNEAVFVDDFSENVVAARKLGMVAVHFADAQQARRELMILTKIK
jgi:epoxide hydrolase-like predicted phosphatase